MGIKPGRCPKVWCGEFDPAPANVHVSARRGGEERSMAGKRSSARLSLALWSRFCGLPTIGEVSQGRDIRVVGGVDLALRIPGFEHNPAFHGEPTGQPAFRQPRPMHAFRHSFTPG
jgi:hypothetical protein